MLYLRTEPMQTTKIVSFDIENHATALQDARLRVRFLHLIPASSICVSAIRLPAVGRLDCLMPVPRECGGGE